MTSQKSTATAVGEGYAPARARRGERRAPRARWVPYDCSEADQVVAAPGRDALDNSSRAEVLGVESPTDNACRASFGTDLRDAFRPTIGRKKKYERVLLHSLVFVIEVGIDPVAAG
jgi:hypothetical protein